MAQATDNVIGEPHPLNCPTWRSFEACEAHQRLQAVAEGLGLLLLCSGLGVLGTRIMRSAGRYPRR
jgi:hypothetical protein